MTQAHVDVEAVLNDLKDFQRRTARWAFKRMFEDDRPTTRFLVADEVGLGKTHVAKGVVAQVIDHLGHIGDQRHDIVYVCSNAAIARQNLRKLVPKGIEPLEDVGRLTMLPLATLNESDDQQAGVNLIAITPGTSLSFGRSAGRFEERCLAYAFLRAHWGADVMTGPARRIFWHGITQGDPDKRLRDKEREYRPKVRDSLRAFAAALAEIDHARVARGWRPLREIFDQLTEGLKWKRSFPWELWDDRNKLIAEIRRIMATVGIASLEPDLVILDEFQRFKDLLRPHPHNFAAELAHRLFDYTESSTGRSTRTLLLSATPYRMYTTADDIDSDHYADFVDTCRFLFGNDTVRVDRLRQRFKELRTALTSAESFTRAGAVCSEIAADLRLVMSRTERLAATPDRDGMLSEVDASLCLTPDDLRSYLRIGDLAETVRHREPTEYWKSAPYLVNFMERYQLKEALQRALDSGRLADEDALDPGPGLLSWDEVEAYEQIDPQNGRLRWLIDDLERQRAFELLWVPPSIRYYDADSVYESAEASGFTKRLVFSGWRMVPKVVSSLVSLEAERRAYEGHDHHYSTEYGRRGGHRLEYRTSERTAAPRPGGATGRRRAAAMTTFLLVWPSPSLAELGDPRRRAVGGRRSVSALLAEVSEAITVALAPLVDAASTSGSVDRRWYWAAPLLLDQQRHPETIDLLLGDGGARYWQGDHVSSGFRTHLSEAAALLEACRETLESSAADPDDAGGRSEEGVEVATRAATTGLAAVLGRPPPDLAAVLAEMALGGPAQCALRSIRSTVGLPISHEYTVANAAWIAEAFRSFFNAPEVTGIVAGGSARHDSSADTDASEIRIERHWRDVVRHAINGNLQAMLDEHTHMLRDWLGHLSLSSEEQRQEAADDLGYRVREALDLRTSVFRVDIPVRSADRQAVELQSHRMRTRFAVAFGNQQLDDGSGEARIEAVSRAFNSPFWPFVLTSTSVGQEGLDFHLWCHAVVHWNLPTNPVDLEQREGRVHRYKGHAVRRNLAATLGPDLLTNGTQPDGDLWNELFDTAVKESDGADGAIVPYWVFNDGPAKIQRHVPVLPFSREAATVSQLRKALAAYRLAFGQPRQEELVEFLSADRTDEELLQLAERLKIDLSPPAEHEAPPNSN